MSSGSHTVTGPRPQFRVDLRELQSDDSALGVENTLYYDNELKIWREKGKPPPEAAAPLPPPPIYGGPSSALEPPPAAGGPPPGPPGPPQAFGGVQNRYVNTLATRWGCLSSPPLFSPINEQLRY